jgi:hypothetical protein
MRKLSLVLVPLALCPFTAASQTVAETASPQRPVFETPLPTGTALRLQLRDGDFRVVGTIGDKISIHAAGKKLAQSGNIKVQVQQFDHAIELRLSHVPKNELQVTIEIPRSTNLYARMRGGDLSVSGITVIRISS